MIMDLDELSWLCASLSLKQVGVKKAVLGGKGKHVASWKVNLSLLGKVLNTKPVNQEGFLSTIKMLWLTENVLSYGFNKASFWIQMHNTPMACMNKEAGVFLVDQIRVVEEVDLCNV